MRGTFFGLLVHIPLVLDSHLGPQRGQGLPRCCPNQVQVGDALLWAAGLDCPSQALLGDSTEQPY